MPVSERTSPMTSAKPRASRPPSRVEGEARKLVSSATQKSRQRERAAHTRRRHRSRATPSWRFGRRVLESWAQPAPPCAVPRGARARGRAAAMKEARSAARVARLRRLRRICAITGSARAPPEALARAEASRSPSAPRREAMPIDWSTARKLGGAARAGSARARLRARRHPLPWRRARRSRRHTVRQRDALAPFAPPCGTRGCASSRVLRTIRAARRARRPRAAATGSSLGANCPRRGLHRPSPICSSQRVRKSPRGQRRGAGTAKRRARTPRARDRERRA